MFDADDSRDAIFMVQPEEMGCYKSLKRVVDKLFASGERFVMSSNVYSGMDPAEDGVNRQLRSMLFIPANKTKRGVQHVENGDMNKSDPNTPAGRQTQKQTKQKERCENRLMSLLFATIYDPATKRCRLVQEVPPLKLHRPDKNGQIRTVSNYTDVRMYLRNSMASILSTYSEAVKVLSQLLPHCFGVLPTLFTIIARTLLVIIKIDDQGDASEGPGPSGPEEFRRRANDSLEYCMVLIQNFITPWERRNFSTDNPLAHCLEAGINNGCYESIRHMLKAMISVLTPSGSEPYDATFRQRELLEYGLPSGLKCITNAGQTCFLGSRCPGARRESDSDHSNRKTESEMTQTMEFIDALTTCARTSPTVQFQLLDDSICEDDFSTSMWKYCEGLCALDRMESNRWNIQSEQPRFGNANIPFILDSIRRDIATCWSALGRSNIRTWDLLKNLNIEDKTLLKETAIELIFGGAMAAISLFERQREIVPICANLRSKKGPMVVRMLEELSEAEAGSPHGGVASIESPSQPTSEGPTQDVRDADEVKDNRNKEKSGIQIRLADRNGNESEIQNQLEQQKSTANLVSMEISTNQCVTSGSQRIEDGGNVDVEREVNSPAIYATPPAPIKKTDRVKVMKPRNASISKKKKRRYQRQ